jgi:hypothetical protein
MGTVEHIDLNKSDGGCLPLFNESNESVYGAIVLHGSFHARPEVLGELMLKSTIPSPRYRVTAKDFELFSMWEVENKCGYIVYGVNRGGM